ncbi:MAG TPA: PH domain-containing protein [Saprospiraceae bacterium]|nr:PH domain-containing protein [Saprospiraceae bacterium]MCB9328968.1 PH domain-containing protein [Lewinellaceae bacterium]HPQ20765.1 PH domain-containing protein [Saprospiraceae bacterium]HRX28758.1 PH domain-containing protein [Saprospiraceae bacterium]
MVFENNQHEIGTLPSIDAVQYERVSPKYVRARISVLGIFFVASIMILTILSLIYPNYRLLFYLLMILMALFGSILVFYIFKSYKHIGVVVRDHDIMYKEGLWFRNEMVITFNKIQHIEISMGAIERFFNLSSLKIFTAGGSGSDLEIHGLERQNAQKLKDFILGNISSEEE